MVDPLPDSRLPGAPLPNVDGSKPGAISRPDGSAVPKGPGRSDEASPGFQALLDQIETRARDLAVESNAIEAPDQLAGAVDSARESLETVLDLKERLLEAYRQQQQQAPATPEGGASGTGDGAV